MAAKSNAEKLRLKPGGALWCSDPKRQHLIEPLPDGARTTKNLEEANVAVLFADGEASLRKLAAKHKADLGSPILWVAYPKGGRADINRDTLWPILAEHGLRPISQVALDEVWSALRFRPLKEGEDQFGGGRKRA